MKTKYRISILICQTLMFLSALFLFLMSFVLQSDLNRFNFINPIIASLDFIPLLIIFFYLKKIKRDDFCVKNKIILLLIILISTIITVLYSFYFTLIFSFSSAMSDLYYESTDNKKNKEVIQKISKNESYGSFSHFPLEIPNGAKNYHILYSADIHGEGVYYLRFSTDKKYIENVLNTNKDKIIKKIPYSKIDNYYKVLDSIFNIPNNAKHNYTVYLLKQKQLDKGHASGIMASDDEIVFFYANYNIEY